MTSRKKLMVIALVFSIVLLSQLACGNTNDVPDVGEETLDEMIEDTTDVVETAVSTACALCTAVNGDDVSACCGVCD